MGKVIPDRYKPKESRGSNHKIRIDGVSEKEY